MSHLLDTVIGLLRRRRPVRAAAVLAQRLADELVGQRQVVFALDLASLPPAPPTRPEASQDCAWVIEERSREDIAELFPDSRYDVANTNGSCAALLRGTSDDAAGYAVWKRPADISSYYFDLPADSVYCAFVYIAPHARGGFRRARLAFFHHLRARGHRWLILSTNDWNEKMIRACLGAGMTRLGTGRFRNGQRRFRPCAPLPWLEPANGAAAADASVFQRRRDARQAG